MAVYRIYFDKNNTIQRNSYINTGLNPVSELFYGNGFSRLLLSFDTSEIKRRLDEKEINLNRDHRIFLNLKNTLNNDVAGDFTEQGHIDFKGMNRASSFDLECYPLQEDWDEGKGYDFRFIMDEFSEETFKTTPSNWFYRQTGKKWKNEGGLESASLSNPFGSQHFDHGNEDLQLDITTPLLNFIQQNFVFKGLMIKFPDELENQNLPQREFVGFFTRHTHTFFEPHIEIQYDNQVKDARYYFIQGQTNKLYFFAFQNQNLVNLDKLPMAFIGEKEYSVSHEFRGTYYIEVDGSKFNTYMEYNDLWKGLELNGSKLPDTELSFVPVPLNNEIQLGRYESQKELYSFHIDGIQYDEKIKRGEERKIEIVVKEAYSVDKKLNLNELYYRLFVLLGTNEVNVIDWEPVSRISDENFFILETEWLIPQTYYIDVMVKTNDETRIYDRKLKFDIVSQFSDQAQE